MSHISRARKSNGEEQICPTNVTMVEPQPEGWANLIGFPIMLALAHSLKQCGPWLTCIIIMAMLHHIHKGTININLLYRVWHISCL